MSERSPVTVPGIAVSGLVAMFFLGAVFMLVPVASHASGIQDLIDRQCVHMDETAVANDGSILVGGASNGDCQAWYNYDATLFKLRPDGTIDKDFSNGGVRIVSGGDMVQDLIPVAGNKTVVVTDQGIWRLDANGTPDSEFGPDGFVRLANDPYNASGPFLSGGAVDPAGNVFVAYNRIYGEIEIRKLTADGEVDPSFGTDGIATPGIPAGIGEWGPAQLAIDSAGRVVAGAIANTPTSQFPSAALLRLKADGDPDESFGQNSDGFQSSLLPAGCVGQCAQPDARINSLEFKPDGGTVVVGTLTGKAYEVPESSGFAAIFDPSGIPVGPGTKRLGDHNGGAFAQLPDGDLLLSTSGTPGSEGNDPLSRFGLGRVAATGEPGFPGGTAAVYTRVAPESTVADITYVPSTNQAVVMGHAGGYLCEGDCGQKCEDGYLEECADGYTQFLVLMRRDARTGAPDPDFGRNGVVRLGESKCGYLPNLCEMPPPRLGAKARIISAAGRRPGLTLTVGFAAPQPKPGANVRVVQAKLPPRIKLKKGAARKAFGRLTAKQAGLVRVSLSGRTLTMSFRPDADSPDDVPVKFELGLKRGAIKPFARKELRQMLGFKVRGAYRLPRQYEPFYRPKSSSVTAKTRPVEPRR